MKKKKIVIVAVIITLLSFFVPIKMEEEWKVRKDDNSDDLFRVTIFEKYKIYYNMYNIPVFQKLTGETSSRC